MGDSPIIPDLTLDTSDAKLNVGSIVWTFDATNGLRAFRYMQTAADTAVVNGTALGYSDTLKQTASLDETDYDENRVAGVGIGVITAGNFGFVQCFGYHAAVLTNGDDDIAENDHVILDVDSDGVCDSVAAGTAPGDNVLGVAVADDINGDNTVAVQLNCI